VFVDVTAYNTKNYYILGDVQIPGQLVLTGSETVLNALNYAGGLLATADPNDVRLVRPGSKGRPSKIYKIDLEAIRERGDKTANYQLFPGDRLIVGRNAIVKKTVDLERLADPIDRVSNSILRSAWAVRYLQTASPENAAALMKDVLDVWAKALSQTGEVKLDEQSFRKLLLQGLQSPPASK
jgi:polysaccharide export outer membrane protein